MILLCIQVTTKYRSSASRHLCEWTTHSFPRLACSCMYVRSMYCAVLLYGVLTVLCEYGVYSVLCQLTVLHRISVPATCSKTRSRVAVRCTGYGVLRMAVESSYRVVKNGTCWRCDGPETLAPTEAVPGCPTHSTARQRSGPQDLQRIQRIASAQYGRPCPLPALTWLEILPVTRKTRPWPMADAGSWWLHLNQHVGISSQCAALLRNLLRLAGRGTSTSHTGYIEVHRGTSAYGVPSRRGLLAEYSVES